MIKREEGLHIAFSGVDGSGKTTQANRLFKKMTDLGYDTFLFENNDIFSFNIMKSVAHRNNSSFRDYFGVDNAELLMTFDSLRDYFTEVIPNKSLGKIVIVPRSHLDRLAKAHLFGCNNIDLYEEVLSLCKPADIHFFLDVPAEVSVKRVTARGKDHEEYAVMEKYGQILGSFCKKYNWIHVDADRDEDEIHEFVYQKVMDYLTNLHA